MAELCNKCECGCKLISPDCLVRYTIFDDPTVVGADNYTKATMELDDLIGMQCAEELCKALSAAADEATAAQQTDISTYLDAKWKALIGNKFFKMWYGNRVAAHYLKGASIGEITAIGFVFTGARDAAGNTYDSNKSVEAERQRLQKESESYANTYRNKFLSTFWSSNISNYSCAVLPCGCTCTSKCAEHKPKNSRADFYANI